MFDKFFRKSVKHDDPGYLQIADELTAAEGEALEARVIEALRGIYDPELPVNIYDLGLIYEIHIDPEKRVNIKMTLTAPGCPVAQSFPDIVASHVRGIEGVEEVSVNMVWDPPWSYERMSESARLQLGIF